MALLKPDRTARLLFQLPRNCRVYTALSPAVQWGWAEIQANKTNYLLELLVWMKTKDATKRQPQNKPKPFKPDFMIEVDRDKDIEQHTTDDIRDILSKPRG